jgi:hypothetical protein
MIAPDGNEARGPLARGVSPHRGSDHAGTRPPSAEPRRLDERSGGWRVGSGPRSRPHNLSCTRFARAPDVVRPLSRMLILMGRRSDYAPKGDAAAWSRHASGEQEGTRRRA